MCHVAGSANILWGNVRALQSIAVYLFCIGLLISFHFQANAYDVDTHFYGTYSLARFAGIKHEVAVKLALATQWMDESFLSDPVSMPLAPITGLKKRRLLHFPSARVLSAMSTNVMQEAFGFAEFTGLRRLVFEELIKFYDFNGDIKKLVLHTETTENDAFASALMMEGLREGNLLKAGASLHVIEDSYAHAGTLSMAGHTSFWHWPDRPYYVPEKYFEMTETVFSAMVAIRAQLPKAFVDCSVKFGPDRPNCELKADALFRLYENVPGVRETVSHNVLRDFEYIEYVLTAFIKRAVEVGYLLPAGLPPGQTFESLLTELLTREMFFRDKLDSYAVLEMYIARLLEIQGQAQGPLLDLVLIPRDMGLISDPEITLPEYIRSYARASGPFADATGVKPFIHEMVRRVLVGYVPIPLSPTHMVEIEDDHAGPREKEMEIRVRGMRNLLTRLYGVDLMFVGNNTSSEEGFAHEVRGDAEADPVLPAPVPGREYATFNAREKNEFNRLIFYYLFPSMQEGDLETFINAVIRLKGDLPASVAERYRQQRRLIEASDSAFLVKFWKTYFVSYPKEFYEKLFSPAFITAEAVALRPLFKRLISDVANKHIQPVGNERFYQNADDFEVYKARARLKNPRHFPEFMGQVDFWQAQHFSQGNELK